MSVQNSWWESNASGTKWILILLAALLLHALIFQAHVFAPWRKPHPIEVQTFDPAKLDAIRKKWKQSLLLDQDKSKPSEKDAPKDARYFSDRNIRVEKEQRSKESTVLPKPGTQSNASKKTKSKAEPRKLPKLSQLGIPLRFKDKPKPFEPDIAPEHEGGNQFVDDKNVPEGSQNVLNAQESIYYSFFSRLYEAIGPIWASQARTVMRTTRVPVGSYSTVVDVVLNAAGDLVEVRMLQSSGIHQFDECVSSAWKKISRFPNPPKGLLDESGQIHTGWNFQFQIRNSGPLEFMPPERTY